MFDMRQRSVGPFDDDGCERLYSIMVKTNKRSEEQAHSGRMQLNILDHYKIYSERNVSFLANQKARNAIVGAENLLKANSRSFTSHGK